MNAMSRRLNAPRPLPAAEVQDRARIRASFLQREWSQACADCGEVFVFHGDLAEWNAKAIVFDETHICDLGGVA